MIFADNAATTGLDPEAFEAMKPFLLDQYANASQPYTFARTAKKAIKDARETIAQLIGASPEEIYFTSGGTESDNWAIKGAIEPGNFRRILTSEIEHHAVLRSCQAVARFGVPVCYLPVDSNGILRPGTLQDYITSDVKLVSIMLVNNEIGTIEPIAELAQIAHANGALFHTDAVQAMGHIPVDVKALGVDLLSASAHKFNGPKGIGFLYIRNGVDMPPFSHGGAQERGKRAGTENVASIVGMAEALKRNCIQMESNASHLRKLESILLSMLDDAGLDYRRNGAPEHIPGNISLSFKGAEGEMLLHRLDLMGICVSTGSACDSHNTQISHVLHAIGLPEEYAVGTIRISLGKGNTEEEVKRIGEGLRRIIRSMG